MYVEPLILLLTFVSSLGLFYGHRALSSRAAVSSRLDRSEAVLKNIENGAWSGIPHEQMTQADCVAVIPDFKKTTGAIASGRGFLSCRDGGQWSVPHAITLESPLAVFQNSGTKMDLVMLSLDPELRPKLLSPQFTIGHDRAASWEGGATDGDAVGSNVGLFGRGKGTLVKLNIADVVITADDQSDRALYDRGKSNSEISESRPSAPIAATGFVNHLRGAVRSGSKPADAAAESPPKTAP